MAIIGLPGSKQFMGNRYKGPDFRLFILDGIAFYLLGFVRTLARSAVVKNNHCFYH